MFYHDRNQTTKGKTTKLFMYELDGYQYQIPILTKYVSLTWRTASGADLHEPEWSNLHKHAALLPVNVCARTHLNVCKLLQRRVRLFGLC